MLKKSSYRVNKWRDRVRDLRNYVVYRSFLRANREPKPPTPPVVTVTLDSGQFEYDGGDLFYDPPLLRRLDAGSFEFDGGDLSLTLIVSLSEGEFEFDGGELLHQMTFNEIMEPGEFEYAGGNLFYDPPLVRVLEAGNFEFDGGELNVFPPPSKFVSNANLYMVLDTRVTGYFMDAGEFEFDGGDLTLVPVLYSVARVSQANLYIVFGPEP